MKKISIFVFCIMLIFSVSAWGASQDFKGTVNNITPIGETAWADYFSTSTIAGWAASPTGYIYYKKIGSMCFIKFKITGTSNADATSFTIPYANYNDFEGYFSAGNTVDNGTAATTPAAIRIAGNSATIVLYKDLSTANAWTTSGTKTIYGEFFYEVAP